MFRVVDRLLVTFRKSQVAVLDSQVVGVPRELPKVP